jgi:hypothetical protein
LGSSTSSHHHKVFVLSLKHQWPKFLNVKLFKFPKFQRQQWQKNNGKDATSHSKAVTQTKVKKPLRETILCAMP